MFAILYAVNKPNRHQLKAGLLLGAGLVLGALIMTAIRFAVYKPNNTHYHADFALYVNGVRDGFKGPRYYEELQSCKDNNSTDPHERTHMHNNINDVVHIHARGVTWSHFFA